MSISIKILSPMVIQAKTFAILISDGTGTPFKLAMAVAFFAKAKAIMAGIRLKNDNKKKETIDTIASISAV